MPEGSVKPVSAAKKPLKKEGVSAELITRGMRVSRILALLPDSAPLIAQYGLSCFSCSANDSESLEDGCRTHGMPEAEIDDLVTDLNEMLKDKPERPQTLSVTEVAARALKDVIDGQGKAGWGLEVGLDEAGSFCLELRSDPAVTDKIFSNDAVPELRLFSSTATLSRIGGATIDMRDGRFKLDLPEDAAKHACACGGNCSCGGGDACACEH